MPSRESPASGSCSRCGEARLPVTGRGRRASTVAGAVFYLSIVVAGCALRETFIAPSGLVLALGLALVLHMAEVGHSVLERC